MLFRPNPSSKLREHRLLLAITGYAIVNAVLYCSLLPLWEGFDEAFHYGYVQELSTDGSIPGRVVLSATLLVWAYVLCATYVVKLIPLYGGYQGRANVGPLLD